MLFLYSEVKVSFSEVRNFLFHLKILIWPQMNQDNLFFSGTLYLNCVWQSQQLSRIFLNESFVSENFSSFLIFCWCCFSVLDRNPKVEKHWCKGWPDSSLVLVRAVFSLSLSFFIVTGYKNVHFPDQGKSKVSCVNESPNQQ